MPGGPCLHDEFSAPLGRCLLERSSRRRFGLRPLEERVVLALLWAMYGVSMERQGWVGRTVPSAGALYPLRLTVFVQNVVGLRVGIYRFVPDPPALDFVRAVPDSSIAHVFRSPSTQIGSAGIIVVITARFDACCAKYGERGYRYLLLEAGHAAAEFLSGRDGVSVGLCPARRLRRRTLKLRPILLPRGVCPVCHRVWVSRMTPCAKCTWLWSPRTDLTLTGDIRFGQYYPHPECDQHGPCPEFGAAQLQPCELGPIKALYLRSGSDGLPFLALALCDKPRELPPLPLICGCGTDDNPLLAGMKAMVEACERFCTYMPPRARVWQGEGAPESPYSRGYRAMVV